MNFLESVADDRRHQSVAPPNPGSRVSVIIPFYKPNRGEAKVVAYRGFVFSSKFEKTLSRVDLDSGHSSIRSNEMLDLIGVSPGFPSPRRSKNRDHHSKQHRSARRTDRTSLSTKAPNLGRVGFDSGRLDIRRESPPRYHFNRSFDAHRPGVVRRGSKGKVVSMRSLARVDPEGVDPGLSSCGSKDRSSTQGRTRGRITLVEPFLEGG